MEFKTQKQFHAQLLRDSMKWTFPFTTLNVEERRLPLNGIYRIGFEDGLNSRFRFEFDGNDYYRSGLHAGTLKRYRNQNTLTVSAD